MPVATPCKRFDLANFILMALTASTLLASCGQDQVLQASLTGSGDAVDAQTGLDGLPGGDGLAEDATATQDIDAPDDSADSAFSDAQDAAGDDAGEKDAQVVDIQGDATDDAVTTDATQDSKTDDAAVDAGCQAAAECPEAVASCQVATCSAGQCGFGPAADATPCDDGNACTGGDHCQVGVCTAGSPVVCNGDGNPCLTWSCGKETGTCVSLPSDATCSDGSACTSSDACKDGKCAGTPVVCSDDNPCTDNGCDPQTGCTVANNTAACATGNLCVKPGTCKDGACAGSVATECDDGNPCTVDSCDPASGVCQFAGSVVGACEDGNPCTAGDTCQKGLCKAGAPKVCDDVNPCTTDICVAIVGCVYSPVSQSCSDGDPCTENDACSAGTCKGAPVFCDDGNPCTNDTCDKAKGCMFTPNSLPCSGDACHTGSCSQGKCTNLVAKLCNDNNACTTDSCDPIGGCANKAVGDNTACGVGTKCVQAPVCKAGSCLAPAPVDCGDGNACTTDTCDLQVGCSWSAVVGACNDGNACTVGEACAQVVGKGIQCTGGTGIDVAKVCDDKNACTTETCDPSKGCIHSNNTLPCNDNNDCTSGDACLAGSCTGSPNTKCDDGNACTLDKCDPASGTCSWSQAAGALCTDNNPCTVTDTCVGAQCVGSGALCDDNSACTSDSCDKGTGKCSYGLVNCSDANLCTTDTCDSTTGKCLFTNNVLPCVIGDKCAAFGVCDGKGTCQASGGSKCDDKNPCTADSCDGTTGICKNVAASEGSVCDDGIACTNDSVCTGGKCQTPNGCMGFSDSFTCPNKQPWTIDVPAPTPPQFARLVLWAVDGTPMTAADSVDHSCTLNFNNGTNYCDPLFGQPGMCQVPIGTATQPTAANFAQAGGLMPTLVFDTYYDVDTFVQGGDQPLVEVLDSASKAVLFSQLLPVAVGDLKKWKDGYKLQVPAAVGKQVLVRFSLNQPAGTTGSQGNAGTGFFIDNLKFTALPGPEVCGDGYDNDGNFKTDCADPACSAVSTCAETDCTDGLDNDKDGATDCADSNCTADLACSGTTLYSNNFECTDKAFTFFASDLPITWAVDATPNGPKPPTGTCSLNYNNGTSFDNGLNMANAGSAISNFTIDASGKTNVRLDLWGYFDTELGAGTSNFDRIYISASTDDFAGCSDVATVGNLTTQICKTANTFTTVIEEPSVQTWVHLQMPLTGMGGKKFKLRIKFDSGDGINNGTAGPFLDDLRVFGL